MAGRNIAIIRYTFSLLGSQLGKLLMGDFRNSGKIPNLVFLEFKSNFLTRGSKQKRGIISHVHSKES